ncbi:MAG: Ig-like domain-containing protein [Eubacterium sp.]|nr:Ig-like domain-containing protein [Eubacterium sp.]
MCNKLNKFVCSFLLLFLFGTLVLGTTRAEAAVKVKKVTVKSNYGKIVHVAEGKKVKLTTAVTVTPNKTANRKVRYTSSNTKVAKVTTAGYVKGVAAGSCKVTVASARNSKIKAKISVKVVKPVTKVEFDASSGSMYVGETKTLKKIITPSSGSFKGVVWSSSNTKIATVTDAGKIKAIAAGSVTIKATSVEGSSQSAKYKLKVQTPDTINIESVEVLATDVVRVTLDKAKVLQADSFVVDGKQYEAGKFLHTFEIRKFRNYDNKTYDLTLADNYSIKEDSFVRVRIASLPGNGTKSKTVQASYEKNGMPKNLNWIYEVGDEIREVVDVSDYCTGNVSYAITGGVDGLECKSVENTLVFSGKMTSALVGSDFLIDVIDEMGASFLFVVHIYVGSEDTVVAAADDVTLLTGIENDSVPFAVAKGGSGQYIFVASGLPIGVRMNEDGTLSGAAVGTGEYEVLVTAIDKENNSRVANVSQYIHVADPRKIIGSVTDAQGNAVTGAAITCVNVNDGTTYETTSDANGTYSLFVEEGSYDIQAVYLDYDDRVYNLSVSSGGRQLNFIIG